MPIATLAIGLKNGLNNSGEDGYYVKDGVAYPPTTVAENYVDFGLPRGLKVSEVNHSHHLRDVLAFDPGDIKYLHYLYTNGNIDTESITDFRYLITINDHVLSLQITNEAEYKLLADDLKLGWVQGKKSRFLKQRMSDFFFREMGVKDMDELFKNPQGDPMAYTAGLVAFFAEQPHGSAISISVGKQQGDTVVWEAKEVNSIAGSQQPQMENRCN